MLTLCSTFRLRDARPSFPTENATRLRDFLIQLTGRLMASGRSKVILRKLFVAVRCTSPQSGHSIQDPSDHLTSPQAWHTIALTMAGLVRIVCTRVINIGSSDRVTAGLFVYCGGGDRWCGLGGVT